ncbi:uncharacterized protein C8Q71DRAFT_785190 [Rhodofomes roseus]|uniref:Chromo domain-containing protein n=1 Tax=Rhodofomes roseus TaxID=34475 RepID=A0ABQ8K1Q0_9APHY|nr:uncharacterized protein C8Q71DRAFT_785190 [Rhodofomes roseus]KAH9830614.1 hypothetical protein C8Q71DRAFT_785190 [Rhodofomes roseus]
MHRDISEGNILIANGRGFLHDLDYAFNWMAHLLDLGYEHTVESWREYVRTTKGIPRKGGDELQMTARSDPVGEPSSPRRSVNGGDDRKAAPPTPIINRNGEKEYFIDAIVAEGIVEGVKKYLVRWTGCGNEENTWAFPEDLRRCIALVNWLKRPAAERTQLSEPYLSESGSSAERDAATSGSPDDMKAPDEAKRMECKERTGTLYFMSVEVLEGGGNIIHDVRHDLESFFWLLMWLVLRHTDYVHREGSSALQSLFDQPSDAACAERKKGWLMSPAVTVQNNAPLSQLINQFKRLCKLNMFDEDTPSNFIPLTYDSVLKVFDDALERDDWPSNDKAIPFKPLPDPNQPHRARPEGVILSSQVNSEARRGRGPIDMPAPGDFVTSFDHNRPMPDDQWTLSDGGIPWIQRAMTNNDGHPQYQHSADAHPPLVPLRPDVRHTNTWAGDVLVERPDLQPRLIGRRPLARKPGPSSMSAWTRLSGQQEAPDDPSMAGRRAPTRSPSDSPAHSSDTDTAGQRPCRLPSVERLIQAAPDSPPHSARDERLLQSYQQSLERMASASGEHRTRRKRSHEEMGRREDEDSERSKRSRSLSQQPLPQVPRRKSRGPSK